METLLENHPDANPAALLGEAMNAKVYMFADAFAKAPKDCELATVIEAVRTGRYAAQVARLRELRAVNVEAYQSEKRKLPAFLVSGTAASRTEPLEHSGFLQGDLDKLNGTLEAVRDRVKADPCVAFGFVSLSGDGLKLGLRIDGTSAVCCWRSCIGAIRWQTPTSDRSRTFSKSVRAQ